MTDREKAKKIVIDIFTSPYENWEFSIMFKFIRTENNYIDHICISKNIYSLSGDDDKEKVNLIQWNGHKSFTLDFTKNNANISQHWLTKNLTVSWKNNKEFLESGALDTILNGCDGWDLKYIYRNMAYDNESSGELVIWRKLQD